MTEPNDLRQELRSITTGLRAHLEDLRDHGFCDVPPTEIPNDFPRKLPLLPLLPVVSMTDPVARRVRLEQMEREASACTRCPLCQTRSRVAFSRGRSETDLMFVGEGPGAEEDAQGIPFVGKAGQLLDKWIRAMKFEPDEVYIANVVKCRPPGNQKPESYEMESCEHFLHEQIALVQPKVMIALGATAIEGLLKISGVNRSRGTFHIYRGEIPVMPTFHPAYILRTPADRPKVWSDLQQVMKKLGK